MAKHKKLTLKQLRQATEVLMRFLDEYQTVDIRGHSGTRPLYERKIGNTDVGSVRRCEASMALLPASKPHKSRLNRCPGF